jgi:hypothetical protein
MFEQAAKRLRLNLPISRNFSFRFRPEAFSIINLEVRYAVEEAFFNAELDDEGNIVSMPVQMALARDNSPFRRENQLCYGSFHTPPANYDEDFLVSYEVEAKSIAEQFQANGEKGENELIMAVAERLLPEFRRLCTKNFMRLAAEQSNVLRLRDTADDDTLSL